MLQDSEEFNKLTEQIKAITQYKYEKGLLPDLTNIDAGLIQKQQKQSYMADIKRLISNCEITGNYDERDKELRDYTKKYIDERFPTGSFDTSFNILQSYQWEQVKNIIDIPLQSFLLYSELINQVYFYIQETYIRKNSNNSEIAFINAFIEYSLELLTSINSLLLGNNQNAAISIYRTFYENFIVFTYIQNHPELKLRFLDHANYEKLELQIEFSKLKKIDISQLEKARLDLLSKYEEGFKQDYGWAPDLINKSNKLKRMYSQSDLGEIFNYFYNFACEYTHATALALTTRIELKDTIGFLFGISEIITKEFKELFSVIKFHNNKEKNLLRQWINVASMNFTEVTKKWYNF